ncbi:hypothetical protein NDU88_002232 [Pleurodeles waltl]|uniref:Uncharacterized protein n=1 Tax=Pleurodeles waltl TaxID=8319 RepID=A0AAV7KS53_PLEWA|nr:hypothetical protein NDU88_002232 [Pleurodeles waltl]
MLGCAHTCCTFSDAAGTMSSQADALRWAALPSSPVLRCSSPQTIYSKYQRKGGTAKQHGLQDELPPQVTSFRDPGYSRLWGTPFLQLDIAQRARARLDPILGVRRSGAKAVIACLCSAARERAAGPWSSSGSGGAAALVVYFRAWLERVGAPPAPLTTVGLLNTRSLAYGDSRPGLEVNSGILLGSLGGWSAPGGLHWGLRNNIGWLAHTGVSVCGGGPWTPK